MIQNERIASNGNYEGVFGKITNFNWTFNPDGSYDCKVDLTGMGDMMESLKVNIKLPSKKDNDEGKSSTTPDTASETEIPPIIANKDKTTLNKVLFDLYEKNRFKWKNNNRIQRRRYYYQKWNASFNRNYYRY